MVVFVDHDASLSEFGDLGGEVVDMRLYLAVLLDVFSRRIVGWATADHLRTDLPLTALDMALRDRRVRPGMLVHHTECGYRQH